VLDDGKFVTISPHYDDAVLSCGNLLAAKPGSTVLTVFTGTPPDAAHVTTDWDRRCGFSNAEQAMSARDGENQLALNLLRLQSMTLGLLDGQYGSEGEDARLAATLAAALSRLQPRVILMPLGLFHGDHMHVSNAALRIRGLFRRCLWLAYEEVPYRDKPGLVQGRLAELMTHQVSATPAALAPSPSPLKPRAMQAYRSRLRGLGLPPEPDGDCAAGERYWRLAWMH
jgi:LmbE family N-acetylglucosaminyl deacetylase